MKLYADSSFIVALYLPQRSSAVAAGCVRTHGVALPFTPWHRLEVRNAIRLAAFHGLIDQPQRQMQLRQVEADLRAKALIFHAPIDWVSVLRAAEVIAEAHNLAIGCRSADLFHVAAAMVAKADEFLTFDERQKKLARAVGLPVGP